MLNSTRGDIIFVRILAGIGICVFLFGLAMVILSSALIIGKVIMGGGILFVVLLFIPILNGEYFKNTEQIAENREV